MGGRGIGHASDGSDLSEIGMVTARTLDGPNPTGKWED